jgi:hypothetical protein
MAGGRLGTLAVVEADGPCPGGGAPWPWQSSGERGKAAAAGALGFARAPAMP